MPVGGAIAVAAAPAVITATGAIINGKQQSNAAKRAAQAQERSASEAIAYQRSRDAVDDSRYDKKWNAYQEYLADYRARHGGGTAPSGGAGGASFSPVSIADLVGSQQNAMAQGEAPTGSVADTVGAWNDWRRYGA